MNLTSALEVEDTSAGRRLPRRRMLRTGRTCRSPTLDTIRERQQALLRGSASRDSEEGHEGGERNIRNEAWDSTLQQQR